MVDSEDFTKTRFWKDIYIWDVWNIWGGAWRQACYSPARGLALIPACPNKIQPPQTSGISICHASVNIRSYEGVCAQRTLFFCCLSLYWNEYIPPYHPLFHFFIRLMKPCKFQTLVSNCATAWAVQGTFTRHWFVGNLTCTGVFIFPFSLWPHMASSEE